MQIFTVGEVFAYFSADITTHILLKNLGITERAISFITESVNGNKVKANRFLAK